MLRRRRLTFVREFTIALMIVIIRSLIERMINMGMGGTLRLGLILSDHHCSNGIFTIKTRVFAYHFFIINIHTPPCVSHI